MGQTSGRPPAIENDDTEDDPTGIRAPADLAALEDTSDGDDSLDDDTTVESPASIRAIEAAAKVTPAVAFRPSKPPAKPIAPLPPMAPITEADGDPTEVGLVPRLVSVAGPPDRQEHTAKLAITTRRDEIAAVEPAPPSSVTPHVEEEPPAELPGLERSARDKWLAIGALALVVVAIVGVAVGRMSAPRAEAKPTASSRAEASIEVPPPVAAASSSAPDDPAPTAAMPTRAAPAPHPPEKRSVVRAVPPRAPTAPRARAAAGTSNGIVRETPF